jgi:hypothetical protein
MNVALNKKFTQPSATTVVEAAVVTEKTALLSPLLSPPTPTPTPAKDATATATSTTIVTTTVAEKEEDDEKKNSSDDNKKKNSSGNNDKINVNTDNNVNMLSGNDGSDNKNATPDTSSGTIIGTIGTTIRMDMSGNSSEPGSILQKKNYTA